jgi:hypothetical protein
MPLRAQEAKPRDILLEVDREGRISANGRPLRDPVEVEGYFRHQTGHALITADQKGAVLPVVSLRVPDAATPWGVVREALGFAESLGFAEARVQGFDGIVDLRRRAARQVVVYTAPNEIANLDRIGALIATDAEGEFQVATPQELTRTIKKRFGDRKEETDGAIFLSFDETVDHRSVARVASASAAAGFRHIQMGLNTSPGQPIASGADALWAALTGEDVVAASEAVRLLVKSPDTALEMIGKRVTPTAQGLAERIQKLVKELDSDDFDKREAATEALERIGQPAVPALQAVLANNPGLELRRRAEALVDKLVPLGTAPERRTVIRATHVLEMIGSPEAIRLLKSLADGDPTARLTEEARAALVRLEKTSQRP